MAYIHVLFRGRIPTDHCRLPGKWISVVFRKEDKFHQWWYIVLSQERFERMTGSDSPDSQMIKLKEGEIYPSVEEALLANGYTRGSVKNPREVRSRGTSSSIERLAREYLVESKLD